MCICLLKGLTVAVAACAIICHRRERCYNKDEKIKIKVQVASIVTHGRTRHFSSTPNTHSHTNTNTHTEAMAAGMNKPVSTICSDL